MGEVDALVSLKSLVLIEVIGYMLFFIEYLFVCLYFVTFAYIFFILPNLI